MSYRPHAAPNANHSARENVREKGVRCPHVELTLILLPAAAPSSSPVPQCPPSRPLSSLLV